MVTGGFWARSGCLSRPRLESTTYGSLAGIELAAHDKTRLAGAPQKGIFDTLSKGAQRSRDAMIESGNFLAHSESHARSRPGGSAQLSTVASLRSSATMASVQ